MVHLTLSLIQLFSYKLSCIMSPYWNLKVRPIESLIFVPNPISIAVELDLE